MALFAEPKTAASLFERPQLPLFAAPQPCAGATDVGNSRVGRRCRLQKWRRAGT